MLTTVETRNAQGDILSLPLQDSASGYVLLDVTGIDPVKANIVTSDYARLDGEVYQSAKRDKRNIIITLQMDPDYSVQTVEGLRRALYRYFPSKGVMQFRFINEDGSERNIEGIVESVSAPIFSKNTIASISIICPNPDFIDPVVRTYTGVPLHKSAIPVYFDVVNNGDLPVGMKITYKDNPNNRLMGLYALRDNGAVESIIVDLGAQVFATKTMIVSTIPGNKYITKIVNNVASSALISKTGSTSWPMLLPGVNKICVIGSALNTLENYTIEFNERHGGL